MVFQKLLPYAHQAQFLSNQETVQPTGAGQADALCSKQPQGAAGGQQCSACECCRAAQRFSEAERRTVTGAVAAGLALQLAQGTCAAWQSGQSGRGRAVSGCSASLLHGVLVTVQDSLSGGRSIAGDSQL